VVVKSRLFSCLHHRGRGLMGEVGDRERRGRKKAQKEVKEGKGG
jgi:hypothetical protein